MTTNRRRLILTVGALGAGALVRRARRRPPGPDRSAQRRVRREQQRAELAQLIRDEHLRRREPTLDERWPRWRFWAAVLCGLVGVLPILLLTEVSYYGFHDVPRERAVVVSQNEWTAGPRSCRAFDKPVIVAFRVDHPRPGFPTDFRRLECPSSLDEKVGDVVPVARKDTTAWPRVDVAPVGSRLYAVLFPLGMGVVFFAIMYPVLWLVTARHA